MQQKRLTDGGSMRVPNHVGTKTTEMARYVSGGRKSAPGPAPKPKMQMQAMAHDKAASMKVQMQAMAHDKAASMKTRLSSSGSGLAKPKSRSKG